MSAGQGELLDTSATTPLFTDSAETMLDAEAHHRDHAIVEQVIADRKNGLLAYPPLGWSPPTPPGPYWPPSRSTVMDSRGSWSVLHAVVRVLGHVLDDFVDEVTRR